MLRTTLQSFHTLGHTLFNAPVPPEAVRATVFQQIPPERLQAQLTEAQQWLSGDTSAVFPLVMKRYSYLRQFAPPLLEHLPVDLEPTGSPALLDAVALLRDLNTTGRRTLPEQLPDTCLPKRLRAFVEINGTTNRRAYACAVLTTLRDEIKRGNVWIRGSTGFGKLDDFFLPDAAWATRRQDFFRQAGLPVVPTEAAAWLTQRLNAAYDRFLAALPANTSVTIDKEGCTWRPIPPRRSARQTKQGWPPCGPGSGTKSPPSGCRNSSLPWIMTSTGPGTACPAGGGTPVPPTRCAK